MRDREEGTRGPRVGEARTLLRAAVRAPEESGLRDARGGLRRSLARLFLPDAQVDSSGGTLTGPRGKGQTP